MKADALNQFLKDARVHPSLPRQLSGEIDGDISLGDLFNDVVITSGTRPSRLTGAGVQVSKQDVEDSRMKMPRRPVVMAFGGGKDAKDAKDTKDAKPELSPEEAEALRQLAY